MSGLALTNPKVQRLRRLLGRRAARRDEGAFVIEGAVLVAEAAAAGLDLDAVFVAPGGAAPARVDAAVFDLAPGVLERLGSTEAPQPVLAVARIPERPAGVAKVATFVVVGARLADPGNAGTLVRTAEAAGADLVVLTAGSVDPWSPKVVRASAGSLFRVPVVDGVELAGLAAPGRRLLGAAAGGGTPYDEVDWRRPFALVLGNEAHGLDDAECALLHGLVSIPHAGPAESLNVAMAGAVLCFEAARQRRAG